MFNRTIAVIMMLVAIIYSAVNVEAAATNVADTGDEFDYIAREASNIGNGNGSPEKIVYLPTEPVANPQRPVISNDIYNADDEWLIYWYICGTNLEADGNQATNDINEAIQVKLPSNVKILIQTGTTSKWNHPIVNSNGRYLYDNSGLRKISDYTANMYEPKTLRDFLKYGDKKYKPDHRILIFWDHGGVAGVCQDQEDTYNTLNLNDLNRALEEVYGKSPKKIPFEIIGFDTCLMGSYECANNIDGFARYMVASENFENQYGWYYTDWLTELAENPTSNGAILGEKICSSSLEDCKRHNDSFDSTFAVVDMLKLDKMHVANQKFFLEALNRAKDSKQFATLFDQMAKASGIESYEKLYVDLKSLATSVQNLIPETSQDLINAVNDVIVGKPSNGRVHLTSGGLSTYYPYIAKSSEDGIAAYEEYRKQNCALQEQKDFYEIVLSESIGTSTNATENSNAPRKKRSAAVKNFPLNNVAVSVDENKHLITQLTPEQLQLVSSVRCRVMPSIKFANSELGVKDEAIVIIGNDVDFKGSWQTGTFRDNFRNVWTALDGHIIFTSVTFSSADYIIYEVPIMLNDEVRTLEISYSFVDKKYTILNARKKAIRGVASRDTKSLKAGDKITPLFLTYAPAESLDAEGNSIIENDGEGVLKITEGASFEIGENPTVEEKPLGDGEYWYWFEFYGPGESLLGSSKVAIFKIENGAIVDTRLIGNTEENTETKPEEIVTD